ncbi:MAG: right-handed parallel beta-helix repeat-containing protein [Pseudomonadota bacterium]|nr:right-handed parallel beta-helix repeat-containing protein [Pseudomonadota bacterium]
MYNRILAPCSGALCLLLWTAPAVAGTLVIDSDFELEGDIVCDASPCVRVIASGVRFDGGGFTLDCGGNEYNGVEVAAAGVKVADLTVANCLNSFFVIGGAQSAGAKFERNRSVDQSNIGFGASAPRAKFEENESSSVHSGASGYVMNDSGAVVENNVATGGHVGILLNPTAAATRVENNQVRDAGAYGIRVLDGATLNVLEVNTVQDSGTYDLSDENAGCDANVWEKNDFATDNELGDDAGPGAGCIR